MQGRIPRYKPGRSMGPTEAESERKRFYNAGRWLDTRKLVLARHPLCESCLAHGHVVEATIVHHRQERLQRPDLAFDLANLAASCGPCHTRHHNANKGHR
jgi:5-methylcytosine-specific restriction protein A